MPGRAARLQLPFIGPTADRTLDSQLSYWKGWKIRARCGDAHCPPNRLICVREVLEARGDMTVRAMCARMRCSLCGKQASSVAFVKNGPGGQMVHSVTSGRPMEVMLPAERATHRPRPSIQPAPKPLTPGLPRDNRRAARAVLNQAGTGRRG